MTDLGPMTRSAASASVGLEGQLDTVDTAEQLTVETQRQ
jgi:hypothetical protein